MTSILQDNDMKSTKSAHTRDKHGTNEKEREIKNNKHNAQIRKETV